MKIGGLVSGMNTDEIIRDLMNANRIPLNKITQKKQYLEWQLDSYRTVNRDLKKFYDNTFDNMIKSTSFTQKTVTISDPNAVSIKNLSSMNDFSGSLQIHQLATNSTLHSGELESTGGVKATGATKLSDLVTNAPDNMKIAIKAPGMEEAVELEFSKDSSIDDVLSKINKETGVNAFFDSHTGKIAMTAKNAGEGSIEVSGTLGGDLKLSSATSNQGVNAEFTFNGLKTERASNTFQINGFEVTLKQVTAEGSSVTFSSAPDTDKILDTVVKFVDEYNTLIEKLNAQIREPKYRDFHALSAEEKGDMKDKEIELWEEKAMSGTLRNDPILSSMLSKMRTALMGSVGQGGPTLKDIGITPSKDYLDNGKLVIDEGKLREAINADPNKVHELFSKDGATTTDQGFARRLRDAVDGAEKLISARAGKASSTNDNFTLGRNLIDMDKQIARFEDRLQMTESRLWKQFNAMEMAIQRLNAQSASFMSNFGG